MSDTGRTVFAIGGGSVEKILHAKWTQTVNDLPIPDVALVSPDYVFDPNTMVLTGPSGLVGVSVFAYGTITPADVDVPFGYVEVNAASSTVAVNPNVPVVHTSADEVAAASTVLLAYEDPLYMSFNRGVGFLATGPFSINFEIIVLRF